MILLHRGRCPPTLFAGLIAIAATIHYHCFAAASTTTFLLLLLSSSLVRSSSHHYRSSLTTTTTTATTNSIRRAAATFLSPSSSCPSFITTPPRRRRITTADSSSSDRRLFTTTTTIMMNKNGMMPAPNNDDSTQKLFSPSADRNKGPMWKDVLETKALPLLMEQKKKDNDNDEIRILEVAAGTGQHAIYFCQQIYEYNMNKNQNKQQVRYYPADATDEYLASILAYKQEYEAALRQHNDDDDDAYPILQEPLPLTLNENGIIEESTKEQLKNHDFDMILNMNMIHISPWPETTLGIMKLANIILKPDTGMLVLYGPFRVNGNYVESNRQFDASLRQRNPLWGIRDLEQVVDVAEKHGNLEFVEQISMPANNLAILFRRRRKDDASKTTTTS